MQLRQILLILFVIFCGNDAVHAVQRFPLPQFESDYTLPETQTPMPSCAAATENGLAVTGYLLLIGLSTWLAVGVRSRRGLFLTAIGSILLSGFVFQGCPCPVGTTQNIVQSLVDVHYSIPVTLVILFFAPLIVSVFYGRTFCASVCPIGAVQEMVAIKPVQLPNWVDQSLGLLRYIYLGAAVMFVMTGLSYIICRFDPVVPVFRMQGLFTSLVFSGFILILGVFVGRPYCRFLCPYGALLGWCAKLSQRHVTVTPGNCTNCRMCENVCPYGAIQKPTQPPSAEERKRGPMRLAVLLVLVPVVIVLFGGIGYLASDSFASLHPDVRLAEMLRAEELKLVPEFRSFDETKAFYALEIPVKQQYQQAATVLKQFRTASVLLGLWVGLVTALKMVQMALRRQREKYKIDPGRCVSCGRCFWYCPNQKENRVFLDEKVLLLPEKYSRQR
ncbi:MAG: 4Fe-4S binding protein [Planctomycetaceae bacterium]|jgi:polyferredoxin|nr:4Fe-4S binding protein [Planctomycetaceae bacterium]